VTSIYKLTVSSTIVISLLCLSVYAQAGGPELQQFTADGFSFNYPGGYSITDESTDDAQRLILTRKGSSVQLTIVVLRRIVRRDELPAAFEQITEPLIKQVATKLTKDKTPPERTAIKTQVGSSEAEGVRLRSGSDKSTGEVVWLRLDCTSRKCFRHGYGSSTHR
jgi:hypothetical protein